MDNGREAKQLEQNDDSESAGTFPVVQTPTFLPMQLMEAATNGEAKPSTHFSTRYAIDSLGNRVSQYEREKAQGIRRKNGARKLKKLNNRQLKIVSLHLAGESGESIATLMGCTQVTVSRILNDPLAREIISRAYEDRQNEIDALAGQAIEAVRDTLRGYNTPRTKLAAVDKFVKLKDSIGREDETAKTAEDVVAQIFKISDSNVQINFGED